MTRPRRAAKPLKLASRLDTAAAQKLRELLLRRREGNLCIDLSEVRWIGAACAELLISAIKTWQCGPHELSFISPSQEFDEGMRTLGFENWTLSTRTMTP